MGALHVAALPFPTAQGTQAAIGAILEALRGAGRDAALLTYAHGEARGAAAPFQHVRIDHAFGDRSLRSGPSLSKLAQDLALARAIARHPHDVVIAHHVEAAAAAILARASPLVFVAHTALGPELPTYLPPAARALGPLAARTGEAVDVALARHAGAVLAVSPALALRLASRAGVDARWLPIPWRVPDAIASGEREAARLALGLREDDEVVLYAGNLDRYQGIDVLLDAITIIRRQRPRAVLVVATASDPASLPAGTRVVPLERDEGARRRLHAAADLAAIPRASEGGLPIKLIDALARGVPVVACSRATAGLGFEGVAQISADDDPVALAAAITRVLDDRDLARTLSASGPRWVARELSPEACVGALDHAISIAAISTASRRSTRRVR